MHESKELRDLFYQLPKNITGKRISVGGVSSITIPITINSLEHNKGGTNMSTITINSLEYNKGHKHVNAGGSIWKSLLKATNNHTRNNTGYPSSPPIECTYTILV